MIIIVLVIIAVLILFVLTIKAKNKWRYRCNFMEADNKKLKSQCYAQKNELELLKKEKMELEDAHKNQCELMKKDCTALQDRINDLENTIKQKDKLLKAIEDKDFSVVAAFYADALTIHYELTAIALNTQGQHAIFPTKNGPGRKEYISRVVCAPKSAEIVKELKEETRQYLEQYLCMKYKYNALLKAFPGIEKYVDGKKELDELDNFLNLNQTSKFERLQNTIENEMRSLRALRFEVTKKEADIQRIIDEASFGKTTWLTNLIADYYSASDDSLVDSYREKSYPISIDKAKDLHALINGQLKQLRVQNKEYEYLIQYYKDVYPELQQTTPETLFEEDSATDGDEPAISESHYYKLSREEYLKLEPIEKNQYNLDKYWRKSKSKWIIGRDYERYIGYLLEQRGYKVYYQGALQGKEDRGIDLVAKNMDTILLIQCKYWKKGFQIRENAINQLYGTSQKYRIDDELREITGQLSLFDYKEIKMCFVTSTTLTETAKEFAKALNVIVKENVPLETYPIIKCNISIGGQKIYHLPYDQKYDVTKIEKEGECYVETVQEAEDLGFRHAYRWHGNNAI